MTIAVDAMGGDRAPFVVVQGAVEAVREYGQPVILVGDSEIVRAELEKLVALKLNAESDGAGGGAQQKEPAAGEDRP